MMNSSIVKSFQISAQKKITGGKHEMTRVNIDSQPETM